MRPRTQPAQSKPAVSFSATAIQRCLAVKEALAVHQIASMDSGNNKILDHPSVLSFRRRILAAVCDRVNP